MIADSRKRIMSDAYDIQWRVTDISPQAQHVVPLKLLQQNNCRSVIDLGCGHGQFLHMCRASGMEVTGVELSEGGIAEAKRRYGLSVQRVDLDRSDLSLPFPDKSFDFSVTIGPPESIQAMAPFMAEMLRIGKKSLFVVPNYAFISRRLGVMFRGRHSALWDPNVCYNFITKQWAEYHITRSGATINSFRATYPHGFRTGPFWDGGPMSHQFKDFEDMPFHEIPFVYRFWKGVLSPWPTLFGQFFVYELEKQS